ncbi:LamG-like jellyroll fold domain-containing protein [uncultured Draconibacterium sp.]|uniref:LamG-like jellyroll fold domain-containing protein n=1 Tax=uncultured Draconibacterium sp. TaxID=1573823 RepID=UPI0025DE069D|nr:LamG-like jellyroll fold domain-containing protein [uncultured Draconibacterium sp.]
MKLKLFFLLFILSLIVPESKGNEFAENTFLIARLSPSEYRSNRVWNFMNANNWTGIELDLSTDSATRTIFLKNSNIPFEEVLIKVSAQLKNNESKITPLFINYSGNVNLLDSIINSSDLKNQIFYLPQGERWPSVEYLVQANRRAIFFIEGKLQDESRILHHTNNYALEISASQITPNSVILNIESNINKELFNIRNFDRLPTGVSTRQLNSNLVPEYINFLLESWTKYGKKPNFLFVGRNIYNFGFIIEHLNSFVAVKGQVRTAGKNLERVYWKNAETLLTGGKFSFPIRGGEEMILTPFVPGFSLTPSQLIITAEMVMPENYSIMAHPLNLSQGLMASFDFENNLADRVNSERSFTGNGYSFSQDIDRGTVLRLPENANVNLGDPALYKLPNSSFTVSCFVKFTDILEYGDNAILGNDERGYRRGLHLVLRSGHPYFGLWANDYMSEELLESNLWYHLTWRYILETGQQAIFVNGQYVGGSDGHPPYSGTNDIHIGKALSGGASLRGYIDNLYIWNRPLGNEEINRLALDEEIVYSSDEQSTGFLESKNIVLILGLIALFFLILIFILLRIVHVRKQSVLVSKPEMPTKNQIQLFGEFKAINSKNEDISELFTPKVRELFIYTLIQNVKSSAGAPVADVDKTLWHGIEAKKVANNRAVTLNKLRKLLAQFDEIEIISNNGFLQLQTTGNFFCDYVEAFKLCNIPEGMTRGQLQLFFHLVKKGRLLKRANWPWLDEIRGFTGNQVIDNLLKLAIIYKKENKLKELEKVAQRIIDYDDLNEEAIYLQIWALQKANNPHLARFNFDSFCAKYEKSMGEAYSMDFKAFTHYFSDQL